MAKTIWKYPFAVGDNFDIAMPNGAVILSVQIQGETPCFWALVDPDTHSFTSRRFRIYGTGSPIEDERIAYVGTFQQPGRLTTFVWHLFEVVPSPSG